jgi:S1-C subfamily serine protease
MQFAIRFLLTALAMALAPARPACAQAVDPIDSSLRIYAVHVSGGLYGVYLGQGLIITAAHVVGSANNPPVRIAGLDLPGKVVKLSPFEQLDLALLWIDEEKLPVSLRLRRMPLCQRPPIAGEPVTVAIPESTAQSQIVSPLFLPPDVRQRFSTVIKDVATTGNSGSGVFDSNRKCLLGVMSRKLSVPSAGGDKAKDIAKYFVPASAIRAFIPSQYRL